MRARTSFDASGGGVAAGVNLLSLSKAASIAARNLSDQGTIDWFHPTSAAWGAVIDQTQGNLRTKKTGGVKIASGFRWVQGGNFAPGNVGGVCTFTTTAGDEMYAGGVAALNTATMQGAAVSDATTGAGFALCIPAVAAERVLRFDALHFNNSVRLTAMLSDNSIAAVTLDETSNQANGTSTWQVNYSAAGHGVDLILTFLVTGRTAAAPNPSSNIFVGGFRLGTA